MRIGVKEILGVRCVMVVRTVQDRRGRKRGRRRDGGGGSGSSF